MSLVTDATIVHATLTYVATCRPACAGTPPDHCYRPTPDCGDSHFQCGVCNNHCAPKLYVDGRLVALPSAQTEFAQGTHHVKLIDFTGMQTATQRQLEVVMPWGGEVQLRGFSLCCNSPSLQRPPASPQFRFVAYGDSITQGFCANTPYPEVLGRINHWNALNLGIGGMRTTPQHGAVLGRLHADLVLVWIGTNDWWGSCDVTVGVRRTIAGLRSQNSTLPVVIVTMLVRGDEPSRSASRCIILEDFRRQIRDEVALHRSSGDRYLYLVEGKPLLSLARLGDGLHPGTSAAMEELAHNLNAQMGFSALQYTVVCSASELRVDIRGATPRASCELFWGSALDNVILAAPCATRSRMVSGIGGQQIAVANDQGGVHFSIFLTNSCSETLFQAVDLSSCTVSRVGRATDGSSATGCAAESFTPPPKLPHPFSPPPQTALPPPTTPPSSPFVSPPSPPTPYPAPSPSSAPRSPSKPPLASVPPRPRIPLPVSPETFRRPADSQNLLNGHAPFSNSLSGVAVADIAWMLAGFSSPALVFWLCRRFCTSDGRRRTRKVRDKGSRRKYTSISTAVPSSDGVRQGR